MQTDPFIDCWAILFDFGGTLDSDGGHWLDRFYDLYAQLRPELARDPIKRAFYHADTVCDDNPDVNGMGLRELMAYHIQVQFSALGIQDQPLATSMTEHFCADVERYLKRNTDLLSRLSRKRQLGIVSNFYGNVPVICHEAGLDSFCGVILDSTRVGTAKPDPAIFNQALARLNCPPQLTAFVGDSFTRDILPAKNLGMRTVWMKGTYPYIPEHIQEPEQSIDAVITALTELEELFL